VPGEVRMWEKIRERAVVPRHIHMVRITEKLNDGVPDTTFCLPSGESGWVELKAIDNTPGPLTKIPWKSPAQPLWLYTWAQRGGTAGVLLRVNRTDEWLWWQAKGTVEWNRMIKTPEAFNKENITSCRVEFSVEWLVDCLLGIST
jgi:hypothetical protein